MKRLVIVLMVLIVAAADAGARVWAESPEGAAPPPLEKAVALWRQGYALHLMGAYEDAIDLYKHSIEIRPTAEAHTFLGWTFSHIGRTEAAIAECKKAIPLDADFGNPYNDIGVYLIDLGRLDEAIPWLEKAMRAKRYCCYEFPHYNLGRILLAKERLEEAEREFKRALDYAPGYFPAMEGLEYIRRQGVPL
jgi:tetratricopeptide (TPR) repeat protein